MRFKLILSIVSLAVAACAQPDPIATHDADTAADARPDRDVSGPQGDVGSMDSATNDVAARRDIAPDCGACIDIHAHEVDVAEACLVTEEPEVFVDCLPPSASCGGLATNGCYLSPDQDLVVLSDTISEPYASLLDMGWTRCDESTFGGTNPSLLPVCE